MLNGIAKDVHPQAIIKYGKVVEPRLTGKVKVSVIITGLNNPHTDIASSAQDAWKRLKQWVKYHW